MTSSFPLVLCSNRILSCNNENAFTSLTTVTSYHQYQTALLCYLNSNPPKQLSLAFIYLSLCVQFFLLQPFMMSFFSFFSSFYLPQKYTVIGTHLVFLMLRKQIMYCIGLVTYFCFFAWSYRASYKVMSLPFSWAWLLNTILVFINNMFNYNSNYYT